MGENYPSTFYCTYYVVLFCAVHKGSGCLNTIVLSCELAEPDGVRLELAYAEIGPKNTGPTSSGATQLIIGVHTGATLVEFDTHVTVHRVNSFFLQPTISVATECFIARNVSVNTGFHHHPSTGHKTIPVALAPAKCHNRYCPDKTSGT